MALTPQPVAGELITAAWGTEIRDRTVQVFATTAERDLWAAPSGALAIVTSNMFVYRRSGSTWRPMAQPFWTGASQVATFSNGQANFTHGLGVVPTWAIIQPRTPSSWAFHYIQGFSAGGVTVLCTDRAGANLNQVTVNAYVQVGL